MYKKGTSFLLLIYSVIFFTQDNAITREYYSPPCLKSDKQYEMRVLNDDLILETAAMNFLAAIKRDSHVEEDLEKFLFSIGIQNSIDNQEVLKKSRLLPGLINEIFYKLNDADMMIDLACPFLTALIEEISKESYENQISIIKSIAYLLRNDRQKASTEVQKILNNEPENLGIILAFFYKSINFQNLFKTRSKEIIEKELISELNKNLQKSTKPPIALLYYFALADIYENSNKFNELDNCLENILKELKKAISIDPTHASIYHIIKAIILEVVEPDEAINELKKALQSDNHPHVVHILMAKFGTQRAERGFGAQTEYETAFNEFKKAIKEDKNNPIKHYFQLIQWLSDSRYVDSINSESGLQKRDAIIQEALDLCKKSLEKEPNNILYKEFLAKLLQLQGKNQAALEIYKELLNVHFKYAPKYYKALIDTNKDAMKNNIKAVMQNSENYLQNQELIKKLRQENQIKEIEIYRNAIKEDPINAGIYHRYIANSLLSIKLDEAILEFQKAIELGDVLSFQELILIFKNHEKVDELIAIYKKALEKEIYFSSDKGIFMDNVDCHTISAIHSEIARLLVKQDKFEEAIAECNLAIKDDPANSYQSYRNIAIILAKQNKYEEADATLNIAKKLAQKRFFNRKFISHNDFVQSGLGNLRGYFSYGIL